MRVITIITLIFLLLGVIFCVIGMITYDKYPRDVTNSSTSPYFALTASLMLIAILTGLIAFATYSSSSSTPVVKYDNENKKIIKKDNNLHESELWKAKDN